MAKRSKAPARPNSVQDRDALINAIARKGELDRQRTALIDEAEAKVTDIEQNLRLALVPIETEIKQLEADVQGFAEANRAALLPDDKVKSVDVGTGTLGWRSATPNVTVLGGEATAVDKLEHAGLWQFVRVEKSVDKAAILAKRSVYINGKAGEPGIDDAKATLDRLMTSGAVKINTGKESFWFTPVAVAVAEAVAV